MPIPENRTYWPHADPTAASDHLADHNAIAAAINAGTGGGGSTWLTSKNTADQAAITLITPADIAGLGLTLAATTQYLFEFFVLYRSAATTTGAKFSVNGPLSPTFVYATVETWGLAAVGTDHVHTQSIAAYDGGVATTGVVTANTTFPAVIRGSILTGATGGTLIARVATEVAGSGITILRGSWGKALAI